MDCSFEGGQCLIELLRWLFELHRGSPRSAYVCTGQQGLNILGGVRQRLRDRLCPPCEDGEVTDF